MKAAKDRFKFPSRQTMWKQRARIDRFEERNERRETRWPIGLGKAGRRGRQYANAGKGTIPFLGSGVRLSSVRQLLLLLLLLLLPLSLCRAASVPWEKSSLDRSALPPPLSSLQKRRNRTIKRSRVGKEAARNGNTGDRSADLLVFVPVLRGFSHTHAHAYTHTYVSKRFYLGTRAQIPRCTYALDRLVCPFERVTGLIAGSCSKFPCS